MKFNSFLANATFKLKNHDVKFINGVFETNDKEIIEELKKIPYVTYEKETLLNQVMNNINNNANNEETSDNEETSEDIENVIEETENVTENSENVVEESENFSETDNNVINEVEQQAEKKKAGRPAKK